MYQIMKTIAPSRIKPFSDFSILEKLSVDIMKYNSLRLKIDHLKGIVKFGSQVKDFGFLVFNVFNTKLSLG